MTETSKPNRARKPTAPVNRRTTSRTWGKSASGFDGSFKRTRYGYPSASARLAMQAESSLWGRKRVVGSKLKHDGTLGFISRGAARRSGLNPAGWHRYVPIVVVAAIVAIALAALGYAGGGANLDAMFKSPELAHAGTELVEGAQAQTGVAPQRGIVAAASTIADAQKDEDEQGDSAETTHANETTTTPSAR
ncbi:hypothetical protein [Collinsella sp. TF08-11AT]|uniref:hypothetical protein n=1 Tax=Collinsella sp. TF08-11AT TaxID=2292333 RepID=UPI0011C15ED8|nr:hypothetical protein [Collinsella sp. TF08-11AT]